MLTPTLTEASLEDLLANMRALNQPLTIQPTRMLVNRRITMISQTAFDEMFKSGVPNVRVLQDELKFNERLTDTDKKIIQAVIGPVIREEKKRRMCARYLRHYRRIAQSLS